MWEEEKVSWRKEEERGGEKEKGGEWGKFVGRGRGWGGRRRDEWRSWGREGGEGGGGKVARNGREGRGRKGGETGGGEDGGGEGGVGKNGAGKRGTGMERGRGEKRGLLDDKPKREGLIGAYWLD
ncbi:hypothetical protein Tco_0880591 [Tanacetum coccineum]